MATRTLSESMLFEEASKVRGSTQPSYLNQEELERLATSKTIINFLERNGYKVDIRKD